MKKQALFIALILVPFLGVQSQNLLIGGTIGFETNSSESSVTLENTTTTEGPTNTYFEVSPFAGIFLNESFCVGLGLGYQSETSKQKDVMDVEEYKVSSSMFDVYPFVRYYYRPLEHAGLFLEGNVEVGFGKNKQEFIDGSTTETLESDLFGISFGIFPGFMVNLTDYLALEGQFGGLQYASFSTKMENDDITTEDKGSAFAFEFNPSFFQFGVTLELGK